MVKVVMSIMSVAAVAADDVTSLLQVSAGVRQSQGQRILAAVAKGDDTICVQAAAGDVAPVAGSFTARASQQAVMAAAGSVAGEAGSFCVAKQDVLLIQRTFGLNTARDFEAALGSKNNAATTTTTTKPWAARDFKGNRTEEVSVKRDACPSVAVGLVQTVDASVSDKQQKKKAAKKTLNDDQLKVCGCRNFLRSSVNMPNFFENVEKALQAVTDDAGEETLLLQRNFDAALASKSTAKKATTTTTTTTTTTIDLKDTKLAKACTAANTAFDDWTEIARQLNNPAHADLYKLLNITDGGFRQCDKSWIVHGACREYMAVTPTDAPTDAPTAAPTDAPTDAPTAAPTDAPITNACTGDCAEQQRVIKACVSACSDADPACTTACTTPAPTAAPEATCKDINCHKGFVKTSEEVCGAISCTQGQCCEPEATCESFKCGEGHFKTSTGGCNALKCSLKDCCDQEATCEAHKCGAGLVKLQGATCNDGSCSDEECCKEEAS